MCVDGNDDACRFSLFGSEDTYASESEDEFEFQLADVFDKHKFGNALKSKGGKQKVVISSISTAVKTKANISGLCDKYRIPRNMDSLVPPKTNTEVWYLIGGQAKSRDVSMQELQKLLGHGLVPLNLVACVISGDALRVRGFSAEAADWYNSPGDRGRTKLITWHGKGGQFGVVNNKLIVSNRLRRRLVTT